MGDQRNFRSSYYEKVGCYSVEETKSLNKLLQDNVRNLEKLKQFCLHLSVPATQRILLWSIILGVHPLQRTSTDYVLEQRKQIYDDLLRAVNVMVGPSSGDAVTPKSQILQSMWMLENNRLLHPDGDEVNFEAIVKVLLRMYDVDTYWTYWVAKEFYQQCTMDIRRECPKLREITQTLLREDAALCKHLTELDVFSSNGMLDKLYCLCFAGIGISESALVKVWDKICGGSRKIVIFIFVELVKTFKHSVLECTTQKELQTLIEQIKDPDAAIINKAIKTWQSNKIHSEITVH